MAPVRPAAPDAVGRGAEKGSSVLRRASRILGHRLRGTDGDVGVVRDLYLDGGDWIVRYLRVATGAALRERHVLIAAEAIGPVEADENPFCARLSVSQVAGAPALGDRWPITRTDEVALARHYGWRRYWAPTGAPIRPLGVPPVPVPPGSRPPAGVGDGRRPDLHRLADVAGFRADAADGEVGRVEDLVIETGTWAVRYVVVDGTAPGTPGTLLIAADWIDRVAWTDGVLTVNLRRDEVAGSPPLEAATPIGRAYERALYAHYGRRGYWETG